MDALAALQSLGMGAEVKGPDGDKMLQQAQQVWSMLDDMAEKDPQAYRHFIEKQRKEHLLLKAPPEPHMCVQTQFQSNDREILFINIISWAQIPKPKSESDNISLYAAPLDSIEEKKTGKTASTIAVAAHPEVLEQYGQDSQKFDEQKAFIYLLLEYVQDVCKRPVSKNFVILPSTTNFKGDLDKAQMFYQNSLKKAMKKKQEQEKSSSGEKPPSAPPDVDIPDSLLSKLANISTSSSNESNKPDQSKRSAPMFPNADLPITLTPGKESQQQPAKKQNLIQELQSDEMKLPAPVYSLERSSCNTELVLRVELPGVKSVSDCELDISEDDVKLLVEGKYEVTVALPSRIDDCEARAKFNKKQCSLTLHMPIVNS